MVKVAILDDWQRVARESANWSDLPPGCEAVFFGSAFANEDEVAEKLGDFEIVIAMRERTAFPASLVARLPKLRMFGMTGSRAATIDSAAMRERGITVCYTGGGESGAATAELALGLMLAAARRIPAGDAAIRAGRFQEGVQPGLGLAGKTLGLIGLGRIGSLMARYGRVLGMEVLAWSQNLTAEAATLASALRVSKEELLSRADVVSLHLVLSARTRGIIGEAELSQIRPGTILVNTSRGPLVDETALVRAIQASRVIAALDVFDREPLPADHPLRRAPNVVLTPHLGYGTAEIMATFYCQSLENILAFLQGVPLRVLAPPATRLGAS